MALQRVLMRSSSARAISLIARASGLPITNTRFSSTTRATVVDSGFWRSLVPKPLRRKNREASKPKKSREWNPATFFIVIFLFIGSMSIQMITLRNHFDRYMRHSELQISKLREVVGRIQNGEQVDVEKALGTGDSKKESDWEELLKAIERDDAARKTQKEKAKQDSQKKATAVAQSEEREVGSETSAPTPKTASLGNFF